MLDEGHNVVTMKIMESREDVLRYQSASKKGKSSKNPAKRVFSIDKWNGSPGLAQWGYGEPGVEELECNMVQGASEGVIFPPSLRPDVHVLVYRKPFCRTLPLRYVRSGLTPWPHKLPAFWYTLGEEAFERAEKNPENSCFCQPEIAPCLPKGLGDLTPCYYGECRYENVVFRYGENMKLAFQDILALLLLSYFFAKSFEYPKLLSTERSDLHISY